MFEGLSGLVGLAVLIADIWAVVNALQSREGTGAKILWVLLIFLLPVLGLIIWFIAGPRAPR